MTVIEQIFDLFKYHGGSLYFGEQVTETEHALQAASSRAASWSSR